MRSYPSHKFYTEVSLQFELPSIFNRISNSVVKVLSNTIGHLFVIFKLDQNEALLKILVCTYFGNKIGTVIFNSVCKKKYLCIYCTIRWNGA